MALIAILTATTIYADSKIRAIAEDGQPLPEGNEGAYSITCETVQEWNDSGCPDNIKIENGTARLKTEAEKLADREAKKTAQALEKTTFTKLQIRRAFRALEQESSLDLLLANNETFRKDWADAIEIDLSDALTQQAITALGLDVNAIKLAIYNQSK